MISAVSWIPRGAARKMPVRQELSAEEMAELRAKADEEMENAESEEGSDLEDDSMLNDPAFASLRDVKVPKVKKGSKPVASAPVAEESDEGEPAEQPQDMDADEDSDVDDEEGDAEDAEELQAQPADAFILVATTEDEYSSLEVQCYNTEDGSLYVHHDITLPTFPVSMAWMDYAGDAAGSTLSTVSRDSGTYVGSFCAIGGFTPDVELWNLDVLDPLEPVLVLKGNKKEKKSKKKGAAAGAASASAAQSSGPNPGHNDAVMGLSWNKTHRHMLASSSADATVKIWDLDGGSGKVLHTYKHHIDKVQGVAWNPRESSVLLAVSYDKTASVTDARAASEARIARYQLPGEPEAVQWNTHAPANFIVSCENGHLLSFDCRQPNKPLWDIKAHGQSVTSFGQSWLAQGLLATASLDKTVKLWDCSTGSVAPVCISSKQMGIGQVFTVSFFPDHPFLLAAGGGKGLVAVWDIAGDAGDVTAEAVTTGPPASAPAKNVAADASIVAKRFDSKIADKANVAGLGIRPRSDGQPLLPK